MSPLYPGVAARANKRCEYCRAPERFFNFAFEVEHIFPRVEGGDDGAGNLVLACAACNRFKATATTGYDLVEDQTVPLFHPHTDDWFTHFRFDADSAEVHGLTGIGRATVTHLRMNSGYQVEARRLWVPTGLYP